MDTTFCHSVLDNLLYRQKQISCVSLHSFVSLKGKQPLSLTLSLSLHFVLSNVGYRLMYLVSVNTA